MELSKLLSNKFVRITLLIFFFLFVYKILFAIGVFFGIDRNIVSMYLCWISMLLLFGSLLPVRKSMFKIKSKPDLFSDHLPNPISVNPLILPNPLTSTNPIINSAMNPK